MSPLHRRSSDTQNEKEKIQLVFHSPFLSLTERYRWFYENLQRNLVKRIYKYQIAHNPHLTYIQRGWGQITENISLSSFFSSPVLGMDPGLDKCSTTKLEPQPRAHHFSLDVPVHSGGRHL
jgi:hypothetical protein